MTLTMLSPTTSSLKRPLDRASLMPRSWNTVVASAAMQTQFSHLAVRAPDSGAPPEIVCLRLCTRSILSIATAVRSASGRRTDRPLCRECMPHVTKPRDVAHMDKVFVSYSHDNSDFADRLVVDLDKESEVSATSTTNGYYAWAIPLSKRSPRRWLAPTPLSRCSHRNPWAQTGSKKELSFAMTGEINKREITVLPAVIADCEVPAVLSDKFYADFRRNYYYGLRKLLEALCPTFYEHEKFIRKEQIENAAQQLRELLPRNNLIALREWFSLNGYALAALFGRLSAVSEAIPRFAAANDTVDFIIINGESGRYELSLIMLGNPTWSGVDTNELLSEAERLQSLLRWCKQNDLVVRRSLALRMASTYGAEQIAPDFPFRRGYHLEIDAKLLCGRREEYGPKEKQPSK